MRPRVGRGREVGQRGQRRVIIPANMPALCDAPLPTLQALRINRNPVRPHSSPSNSLRTGKITGNLRLF